MIFGEWRQWLNNLSRNTRGSAAGRKRARSVRPGLQVLEGREVPAAGFFEGFELDSSGWVTNGGDSADRVISGTDGILSQAGGFHAKVTGGPTASPTTPNSSAFTRWGGYTNTFPAGGYTTSIGIYLDMGTSASNDTRFDFSSAVNTPDGGHRRDFIFNAGFYNDADVTGSGPRFVISASNNSVGEPKNPARDPLTITDSGWYTFQHRFYNAGGGKLAVDLSIIHSDGTVLNTWTLSDPTDIIGSTVGGNRYGWFANNQFSELAVDNSYQSSPDTVYVDDDWASLAVGTDPDGSGPANLVGFDAFSSIQDAINAAASGGTVNVAAGTYLESVTVNKSVTLLGAQAGLNPADRTDPALESIVSAPSGTNGFSIGADNVTVRGFTVTTAGGGVYGVYEATPVTGTVIDRNIVSGFAGLGISLAAGSSGAAVTENDVSNNYAGIYLSTGASNVTVRANVVHDNTGTGFDAGSGIVFEGNNTNVLVSQNFIRDNAGSGIYVWDGYGNDFSGTKITSNSITGKDGAGFNNTNATVIDASGNWWGTSAAAGVTAEISGNVDFMPFLVTGEDTSAEPGFQGDFSVAPGEGSVRVKVVGKRLMITGDNRDNWITVEKGPTDDSYRVTGLYGTQINGQSGSFDFENVTKGIDANLMGGDDMLVLDGSASPFTVPSTIKVRAGRGDDLVVLEGVTGTVKADLGSSWGSDLFQLIDSNFSELAVDWRVNAASTSLELDGVTVIGRTVVRGGNGADTVRAVDSTFGAAVVLNGGRGNNDLDAGIPLGESNTKGNTFLGEVVTRGFEVLS